MEHLLTNDYKSKSPGKYSVYEVSNHKSSLLIANELMSIILFYGSLALLGSIVNVPPSIIYWIVNVM